MRIHRIIAALVLSLSCALSAAACVQSAERSSETEGTAGAPTAETTNENDLSFGPQLPALGVALTTRDVCIAAAAGGIPTKEAFCRSILVPPALKRSCWARVLETRTEWIGWCWLWF